MIGRTDPAQGSGAPGTAGNTIEFANLLDRISVELAELVMFPITTTAEHESAKIPAIVDEPIVDEPIVPEPIVPEPVIAEPVVPEPGLVSRFATAGIDDDRLPLHLPRVRRKRR